jgi:hypothetical protein
VAVRLELPPGARLHDVFHIGLLKKFHGLPPDVPPALPPLHHGAIVLEPEHVVRFRLARGVRQALVQWKDESPASTTWEDIDVLRAKYPALQLEDELSLEGGRCHVGENLHQETPSQRCAPGNGTCGRTHGRAGIAGTAHASEDEAISESG